MNTTITIWPRTGGVFLRETGQERYIGEQDLAYTVHPCIARDLFPAYRVIFNGRKDVPGSWKRRTTIVSPLHIPSAGVLHIGFRVP